MRHRLRLALVGLSLILVLIGMALPGRFGYFALAIVGLWVLYESIASRIDRKVKEKERRQRHRLDST